MTNCVVTTDYENFAKYLNENEQKISKEQKERLMVSKIKVLIYLFMFVNVIFVCVCCVYIVCFVI
jgi:hypothetical protein